MTATTKAMILEPYEYAQEQGYDIVETIDYIRSFSGLEDEIITEYLQAPEFLLDFSDWQSANFNEASIRKNKQSVNPSRLLDMHQQIEQLTAQFEATGIKYIKDNTEYKRGQFLRVENSVVHNTGFYVIVKEVLFDIDSKLKNFAALRVTICSKQGVITEGRPDIILTDGETELINTIQLD